MPVQQFITTDNAFPGFDVFGAASPDTGLLPVSQLTMHGDRNAPGDVVLNRENIIQFSIIAICPSVIASGRVD
jgi:hypothetical protein